MTRAALLAALLAASSGPQAGELTGVLKPGEVRRHTVTVPAGGHLRATVRKDGYDVEVRVLSPGGAPVLETSTLAFPPGSVWFAHVAEGGPQRLVIEVRMAVALGSSRYTIALERRRAAPGDPGRAAARRAFLSGERRRADGAREQVESGIRDLERALALNTAGDRELEADVLTGLARAREALGEREQARQLYERALALHRASGRQAALSFALAYAGALYDQMGQRDQAMAALREAVAAGERAGDERARGIARGNLALLLHHLGRNDEALAEWEKSLAHHRAAGNLRAEANALNGIATVLDARGEKQRALELLHAAVKLREAAGDPRDLASVLNNLGFTYSTLDDVGEAVAYYNRALAAWRAAGDPAGEAATLHNLSAVHEAAGEYQQAIDLYRQALALFRATSSSVRAANTLTNLGRLYVSLGDAGQGVPLLEEALATHRAAGNPLFEAAALANLGMARQAAGDHAAAQALHEQALAIRRQQKDTYSQANTLRELARTHASRGGHAQALALLEEAQGLLRPLPRRRAQAGLLVDVSASRLGLGEHAAALEAAEAARALYRQIGNGRGEASALLAAARVDVARGELSAARERLEAAIALLEDLRWRLAGELRTSFLASVQDYYELLIDVLMRLHGRDPEAGHQVAALEAAERARARWLLDLLAEARAGIREGIEPALLERERALRRTLNSKAARHSRLWAGRASDEEASALAREIDRLTAEYRALQAELRQRSPRYAELAEPRPLAASDIQERVLDADTVLLEFALGAERSYGWTVTSDGVEARELPARAVVEELARRFYDGVRGATADGEAAAAELARMLLPGRLPRPRVLLVPDGALHLVPMAALPAADGRPLAATHEVVTLPSASTLAALAEGTGPRPAPPGMLAVLADPVFEREDPRVRAKARAVAAAPATRGDAPAEGGLAGPPARLIGSRREAEAILAHVPRRAALRALDFDASRATAAGGALARYRIVHFATHGIVDHAHPELSGLVLSLVDGAGRPQDGVLRLHDVSNLRLAADLVVLSACQTALGPNVRGEGLIALTRGFLYAGARSVVASLWRVDDAATAELMRRFYEGMLGPRRLSPAAALRAAQWELAQEPRWAHPRHWAGFVLQGAWR